MMMPVRTTCAAPVYKSRGISVKGKISCNSPIGAALMGKKAGDIVDVKAPAGAFQIKIESVTTPA